jgi:hypothetical protein
MNLSLPEMFEPKGDRIMPGHLVQEPKVSERANSTFARS